MRSDYHKRAAELVQRANEASSREQRAEFLEMAMRWLRLADQAEKNALSDISYETPLPRESVPQPQQQQQQRTKDE